MAKHNNEEAFYQRMRDLGEINKPRITESRALGTLIDYKRASNGVAFAIIKENHHYYVKKGGLKENPDVADFAYIGGLANITENQYPSVASADKQRNMILHTVNEGISRKVSKTGSKKEILTEDKASKEIEMAASKVGDLEAATDAAEAPPAPPAPPIDVAPEGGEEMDAGVDAMPTDAPEGDPLADAGVDPLADAGVDPLAGGEDPLADAGVEGGEEVAVEDPDSEATREIEKSLGKLTNTLRKTELTEPQVKSYVNTFLSAFKDDFPEIDIEDRKAMADKITKVVPPEDIEDLSASVEDAEGVGEIPAEEPELAEEEEQCAECGGFAQYAESRGYNAESMMECGEEEMTNLMSGYANAHSEGQNDGDFKVIALFITPEIIEKLKGDYGHDDFAGEVEPFSKEMNETTDEDKEAQINELFGGLKQLGKAAGQGIKQGAQAAVQGIKQAGQDVAQGVQQAATNVKQTYHAGEKNAALSKLEKVATNLGKQIASVNNHAEKSGETPINVKSILATITNQLAGAAGVADLGKFRTNEDGSMAIEEPVDGTGIETPVNEEGSMAIEEPVDGTGIETPVNEEGIPVDHTEVQPMMKDATIEEDEKVEGDDVENVDIENLDVDAEDNENILDLTKREKPEMNMHAGFEAMGGGVVKPDGAEVTTVEVTKDSVSITMNENEAKLRQYIRNILEEKVGLRKPVLTEGTKSAGLSKLDRIIEKQLKLHEGVAVKQIDKALNKK